MKYKYLLLISILASLLVACGGGDDSKSYNSSSTDKAVLTKSSAGRLLASQCAQCHGTDGISVSGIESLAGESGEILEEMFEMKGRDRNRIMHLQAKGYTNSEIREIANYFSTLYKGNGRGSDNDNNDDNNDNDQRNNDKDGDDD